MTAHTRTGWNTLTPAALGRAGQDVGPWAGQDMWPCQQAVGTSADCANGLWEQVCREGWALCAGQDSSC